MRGKKKSLSDYLKKKKELELLLSLEDQMSDLRKSMLMEKLLDVYSIEDHDGDTTNTQ